MTTLKSKISGVSLWTYDFARRPVSTLDAQGNPQSGSYAVLNDLQDVIKPLTQNPTEYLNQPINQFYGVCDINHVFNGNNIKTHGIKFTPSGNIDQLIATNHYASVLSYRNTMFVGDDIYIQNPSITDTGLEEGGKDAFTTTTQGIKIIAQTGVIHSNRGYGFVIFEIVDGFKIPVGNTIQITGEYANSNTGMSVTGTIETYKVGYEMKPGIYGMTTTDNRNSQEVKIDFATVKDATAPKPTPKPTPKPQPVLTIPIVQNLTNVSSDITGVSINRKLNAINLTADKGYIFQDSIQVLFYSGGVALSDYNIKGNNQNTLTIPLNTTKENTITDNMDNIKLTAVATHTDENSGYEHNYLITQNELNDFSKTKMFNAVTEDNYDVSKYMNNLIELPFVVDTVTTVKPISIGRENAPVVSHETKNRFITVDLGTIKISEKYKNGYDFQSKSIKLFTPFVPPITINNENAINKTIHIVYKVDISNGSLTVNLYNDNVLFFTGTNNIASQLPFLNTTKNTIIDNSSHFNDNDIRQPYIIITRNEPILNNDYYPTIERGLIKNYAGNIKARLLNNLNISNNEFSELNNILESGVKYVKNN